MKKIGKKKLQVSYQHDYHFQSLRDMRTRAKNALFARPDLTFSLPSATFLSLTLFQLGRDNFYHRDKAQLEQGQSFQYTSYVSIKREEFKKRNFCLLLLLQLCLTLFGIGGDTFIYFMFIVYRPFYGKWAWRPHSKLPQICPSQGAH